MVMNEQRSGGAGKVDPVAYEAASNIHEQIYARRSDVRRILYITGLALINGVIVSVAAKLLLMLINLVTNISFFGMLSLHETSPAHNKLGLIVIIIPAIGGIIVGVMAKFGSKAIRGHGIPEAMEKIITDESRIHPIITILKPLSAAISIGTGGPFGAEGPIISTGGALGSFCGQTLHITAQERKVLLASGATAGMTAIFGTPFAAILLAIELLLFEFSAKTFLPVMVACITGACMHVVVFSGLPTFPMPEIPPVDSHGVIAYGIMGLIAGLASVGVTKAVYLIEDTFEKLPLHWMWWPAVGGIAVGTIGYFFPRTLGVGYNNITDSLTGTLPLSILVSLCFWKFISWAIALGSGTSGGTLAPLLTIGSAIGSLLGYSFQKYFPDAHISIPLAALVGMAALFAGASRAILTSIVFAMETTMQESTLLPLIAGCSMAYLVSFILMRTTIMTEKIKRRGIQLPEHYRPDVLSLHTVGDVYTEFEDRVLYSYEDNPIGRVRESMQSVNANYIVILDEKKEPIGFFSYKHIPESVDSHAPVNSLINGACFNTVIREDSLEAALEIILKTGQTGLPVIDKVSKEIIGVISEWDILKVFEKRFIEDRQIKQHISLRRNALKIITRAKVKR
jgi:chloride channel protein, CIC family